VIAEWTAAPDPLAGQRVLDQARWSWLKEHDAWFSFGGDELAVYAAKLMLIDRWHRVAAAAADRHADEESEERAVTGRIVSVFGNMVIAKIDGRVVQNSVGYCCRSDGARLLSEVIRVRGHLADLQVFEETRGLRVGDLVEIEDAMLRSCSGRGSWGRSTTASRTRCGSLPRRPGFFLKPGTYIHALPTERKWDFTPTGHAGRECGGGQRARLVPEGIFQHQIMVPFSWQGRFTVKSIGPAGAYTVEHEVAVLAGDDGRPRPVTMQQSWR